MDQHRDRVKKLLDELEESGERFIGPTVHAEVMNNCKYPVAWIGTLRRYVQLANLPSHSVYVQFYLDLCVTILTKKIIAIDVHRMIGADDPDDKKETSDMRTLHAIMFNMSVSRMLNCIFECVLKCPPVYHDVTTEETKKLYGRIEALLRDWFYKDPRNGRYYAREKFDISKTIHDTVDDWLLNEAMPNVVRVVNVRGGEIVKMPYGLEKTSVLSSDLSFFGVSHCYWLWLHLTAAAIRTGETENDFLTMFYAFDLFVFCPQCSLHFVQHRSAFYTRDSRTISVRTTYRSAELVYRMHNVVNKGTGKDLLPPTILLEYKSYWDRYEPVDAEN